MKDDRLRVPIDDPYLHAVGLALICFARLEWDAVWCCQKLQPGYLDGVRDKTAGTIANDFVALCKANGDQQVTSILGQAAEEFRRLVRRRNDLLHANPGATPDGAQRLFRDGTEWSIDAINDVSDEFAAGGEPLNQFHNDTKR